MVVLTAFSQRDLVERAVEAGVLGYLVKPFQKSDLIPAVEVARARHKEIKEITGHAQTLAERLEGRKVIDRAKSFLMKEKDLAEEEAFRFIQTTAMDGRESMLEVAKRILGET